MELTEPLPVLDGKYQLLRLLGEGGMGAVYEALHLGTHRRVAVKMIVGKDRVDNVDLRRRFEREAMATGQIQSQYVAHTLDTAVEDSTGRPYLVMELLRGESLQQAIRRLGPLAPDLALRIAVQVCLGLQKAHEVGVIHRDIKPANIFLAKHEGSELLVKILDFGIAKVSADGLSSAPVDLTGTGVLLGSPYYMSPEQARGKKTLDHRTDLWSLGIVLYEALTGKTPHGADAVGELIVQICSEPARSVQEHAPWVPSAVAAVVHRALALDPAARFGSAREMVEAIRPLLPSGHALDESLFVPLPTPARERLASLHPIPGSVRAPAPSSGALDTTVRVEDSTGSVLASTTGGISRPGLRSPLRRSPFALASLGVLAAFVVGAGWVALAHRPGPSAAVPASAASASTPAPVAGSPPTALPPVDSAGLVALTSGEPSAPPPPAASGPPVAAAAARHAVAGAPAAQRAPLAVLSSAASASATPAPSCNPPYTLDSSGVKVWKRECFK